VFVKEYAVVPTGTVIAEPISVYVLPSGDDANVRLVTDVGILVTNNVDDDVTLRVRDIYYTIPSSFLP
jgi:hypothetical protein